MSTTKLNKTLNNRKETPGRVPDSSSIERNSRIIYGIHRCNGANDRQYTLSFG